MGANATGMVAMTGNNTAATAAMKTNNMAPAAVTMAGSTSAVSQMAAPVPKPTTITVDTGGRGHHDHDHRRDRHGDAAGHCYRDDDARRDGDTDRDLNRDIDRDGHRDGDTHGDIDRNGHRDGDTHRDRDGDRHSDYDSATKQPTMMATASVARGDLVFVVGVRSHGALIAKLVLFAAPATAKPAPTVTPTVTSTAPAPRRRVRPTSDTCRLSENQPAGGHAPPAGTVRSPNARDQWQTFAIPATGAPTSPNCGLVTSCSTRRAGPSSVETGR